MFYDDFCKTDSQKIVFDAISELSKKSTFIAIQELSYLDIPFDEIAEILSYFKDNKLFTNVQCLGESHPVIFSIK